MFGPGVSVRADLVPSPRRSGQPRGFGGRARQRGSSAVHVAAISNHFAFNLLQKLLAQFPRAVGILPHDELSVLYHIAHSPCL